MNDDKFRVEGEIHIPDDRKELANCFALQILDKSGIRKIEEIELAGRKIKAVSRPCPDESGIVRFNYSIFERKERKTAEYDTNTCWLTAPDSGHAEFGLAMNMIMALQVINSDRICYFMEGDSEGPLPAYVSLFCSLITSPTETEERRKRRNPDSYYLLYKRFLRTNEDEFLEFWDEDELVLSDQLNYWLERWREGFQNGTGEEPEITESLLADTIQEMYEVWNCRLVDKAFAEEFLEHRYDPNYKRAFRLFRAYMDKDLELFPELTRRQAVEWMLRGNLGRHDAVILSAFQSLLMNHKKRHQLFGF